MTILAKNTSVTLYVKENGHVTISTNGGLASVQIKEGATVTAKSIGPVPSRETFGPFKDGASVLIANNNAELDYDLDIGNTNNKIIDENTGNTAINKNNAAKLTYRRAPTAEDNASKGYTINSVWQFKGNMYKPKIAPDNTSALWERLPSRGGFPADVLGTNCKLACGLTVLKAGFTGACAQLTSTVSGSPVLTTINILAGGVLDNDAITNVISKADAGTFVYATTLYDQSGTGNHMVFAASTGKIERSLYVVWDEYFKSYILAADNGGDAQAQGLNFPATLSVREDQLGAFFFGRASTAHAASNSVIVASFGTGAASLSIHMGEGADGITLSGWRGGSRRPAANGVNYSPVPSTAAIASYIGSTGSTQISCNETSYSFGAADTTAFTGGFLGNWDLSVAKFCAMRFLGVVISTTTTPTAAQQTSIRHWFYTKFDCVPQARDRIVYIGDSRGTVVYSPLNATSANLGQAGENVSIQLADSLNSEVEVINGSVSGFTNTNHAVSTIPMLRNTYRAGVKNIAVICMGVNDFIVSAISPAQCLANLNANINTLKQVGWYVIVVAELATNTTTNSSNIFVPQLSKLILDGGTTADYVVNVLDMTAISNPANYPDGLHPNSAQAGLIAARLQPIIDSILVS